MVNLFEKELGIPLPQCCSNGDCCKGASPSTPFFKLIERATQGDEFARNFFSIMIPYSSQDEARKVVPGLVERTLKAAIKSEEFPSPGQDVVFYRCRYLLSNNLCGVHEDRPQFCRDYPDTPFVVMAPGCAFEPWGRACKDKYHELKDEVGQLKAMKKELDSLKQRLNPSVVPGTTLLEGGESQPTSNPIGKEYTNIDDTYISGDNTDNLSLVLSLTDLYLSSPYQTVYLFPIDVT